MASVSAKGTLVDPGRDDQSPPSHLNSSVPFKNERVLTCIRVLAKAGTRPTPE